MDFDQMQTKLDNHEYRCAQDFLGDIDLIAENAIKYNGDPNYETNKVICHRARALQDFAYALVKAEMDTDFEDDCKEIVERRKKLSNQLKKTTVNGDQQFFSLERTQEDSAKTGGATPNAIRKKKPKRRVTKWQRGYTPRPKRAKDKTDKEEHAEASGTEKNNDEHNSTDAEDEHEDHNRLLDNSEELCNIDDEESRLSASAMDASSQSIHEISGVLQIDEAQIELLMSQLVHRTKDFAVEPLERLFCQLMECARQFKYRYDRTGLIEVMQSKLPPEPRQQTSSIPASPSRKSGRN